MSLHILSQGPAQKSALQSCLTAAEDGDALILIGEGVLNALSPLNHLSCYALHEDIIKHGLSEQIPDSITMIDYPEFVSLCTQYSPICSWF